MENYVGKRLDGRYEIQEIIGVGGMAVVYKAYDNIDDRIVAVKILKEEFLANEDFRRRFKNESKAIAVLSHPNIVKVYDVSFGDRLQYIVMEYVDGITLKEYIEQQKVIGWKEAVHFTTQILRALQHAHDKGIVHRDVKPQNIMLLQNGNIKVTDFGIARFSRTETRTMTESAIGSVHYISPEQARGEITDDKADIYSVGVVLYEMLTGQLPFQSDSAVSVAIMQLQSDPKNPRELNPAIPMGLEQITMHAMQKNVRDRYQSAAEMLMDLDELKRNPNVKFDYTYFVDKEPTKFVPTGAAGLAVPARQAKDGYQGEEETAARTKTIPILAGVGVAVIAVIGIVLIILGATGAFSKNKVVVPDFLNKNYTEEIENNEEYKNAGFQFEIQSEYSTTKEAGTVVGQDPPSGRKIDPTKQKITLTIASASQPVNVPDVTNMDQATAIRTLREAGFNNVTTVYEFSKDVDVNKVIRTNPAKLTDASPDIMVTIYINNGEDDTQVVVPKLTGLLLDDARSLAESQELTLDVEMVDSEKPENTILSQNPIYDGKVKIAKKSAIKVTVSNGKAASKAVNVSFTMPQASDAPDVKLTVYLNGARVDSLTKNAVMLNGQSYNIEVTGSGTQSLIVKLDNVEYYSATIDFGSGAIHNAATQKLVVVPDVVNLTEAEARARLSGLGLVMNVSVREEGNAGKISEQTPKHGTLVKSGSAVTVKLLKGQDDI